MLKIRKNSLDNIQLGKKKEDLPESIINNTLYFLEFLSFYFTFFFLFTFIVLFEI